MRTHRQVDQLKLELGRAAAAKLREHPALFHAVVHRKLHRWRREVESGDASSRPYLEQWEKLAAQGLEACLARISEDSERSAALRQASPFAGILTATERMHVIHAWRAKNEAGRS